MKQITFLVLIFFVTFPIFSQPMEAEAILEKSIAYHDPQGRWHTFVGYLTVESQSPNASLRTSVIQLDLPKNNYQSTVRQDGNTIVSKWHNGQCQYSINGETPSSPALAEKFGLNCDRTTWLRNYYLYLYGLPMKLKDPGTHLHPEVAEVEWMGGLYYRLRVDYDPKVGNDRWYFYFDTTTYQLRHYQFYHDESQNDGEYILLAEEQELQGMKIPKTRAWYTNKEGVYLGTDTLVDTN